jgi:hypothetical protein
MANALVLFSGGQDSAACLAWVCAVREIFQTHSRSETGSLSFCPTLAIV